MGYISSSSGYIQVVKLVKENNGGEVEGACWPHTWSQLKRFLSSAKGWMCVLFCCIVCVCKVCDRDKHCCGQFLAIYFNYEADRCRSDSRWRSLVAWHGMIHSSDPCDSSTSSLTTSSFLLCCRVMQSRSAPPIPQPGTLAEETSVKRKMTPLHCGEDYFMWGCNQPLTAAKKTQIVGS